MSMRGKHCPRRVEKRRRRRHQPEEEDEVGYVINVRETEENEEIREITKLYIEMIYYREKDLPSDFIEVKGMKVNKKTTEKELKERYEELRRRVWSDKRSKKAEEKRLLEMIRMTLYKPEELDRYIEEDMKRNERWYKEWDEMEEKIKRGEIKEGDYILEKKSEGVKLKPMK